MRGDGEADVAVVAEFAELLSLCLSAGLSPDQALALAAGSSTSADPRRAQLAALLYDTDGHPVPVLPSASRGAGQPRTSDPRAPQGAQLLLLAWWMSRQRGSPLAAVVSTCAHTLREADAADRRRRAAEAGPRASMWLLSALPVVGPVVATLAGVDVRAAYATPSAAVSCGVGLGLTGVGWLWARRLLASAARPERYS